jgi:hypothetical protein
MNVAARLGRLGGGPRFNAARPAVQVVVAQSQRSRCGRGLAALDQAIRVKLITSARLRQSLLKARTVTFAPCGKQLPISNRPAQGASCSSFRHPPSPSTEMAAQPVCISRGHSRVAIGSRAAGDVGGAGGVKRPKRCVVCALLHHETRGQARRLHPRLLVKTPPFGSGWSQRCVTAVDRFISNSRVHRSRMGDFENHCSKPPSA